MPFCVSDRVDYTAGYSHPLEATLMKKPLYSMLSLVSLAAAALLTGCGGGGGASSGVTFSGVAAKGLIANGLVEVFEVENGVEGTKAIASTSTDNTGAYSLTVPTGSKPVVVKVSRKDATTTILDEISGNPVVMPADFSLRSFAENTSKQTVVSINPFTEMAVSQVPAGQLSTTVVARAGDWVKENFLGGAADPFKIAPSIAAAATPEQKALYARLSEVAALQSDGACAGKTGSEAMKCAVEIVKSSVTFSVTNGDVTVTRDAAKVAKLAAVNLPNSLQSQLGSAAQKPTTLTQLANANAAVPAVRSAAEATAAQFASDLSLASRTYKKFLDSFGTTIDDLGKLALGAMIGESYLLGSLGELCDIDATGTSFTCNNIIAWDRGKILSYGASSDYKMTLAGSANDYTYTISGPNSASYTGTIKYDASKKTGRVAGKVPEFYKVNGQSKTREASLEYSIGASVLGMSNLTSDTAVTGGASYGYSAAATADLVATSITLSGELSGTYKVATNNLEDVKFTGKVTATVDENTFTGTLKGMSKTYDVVTGKNTKRQEEVADFVADGKFTLKSGEVAEGSITLTPNYSNVNFGAPASSTNFGTGTTSATLKVYDATKANYALITIDLTRSEFTKGTAAVKINLGTDTTKRWVAFTATNTLNTSNLSYGDYITFDTVSSGTKPDITISSSDSLKGTYVPGTRATNPSGIMDKDNVKVGSISGNQLFIGGSVSPILFE
jgi:hypothetical protein